MDILVYLVTVMSQSNPSNGIRIQIVIPMSGFGERFRKAGYAVPKPLIEVDGKPIIAHVVDLFPGELDWLFICNEEHLANAKYRMAETLARWCPTGRVVGIEAHKLGPVHAVQQVAVFLDPSRPVIVNYCDFSCYWNWEHFVQFTRATKCAGALPAYRGFHPHSLGTTNYAYIRELNGWMLDIQEKRPFTEDRMQEYASSGTYYFSTARRMLEAFDTMIARDLSVGGEYYVSLAYKSMLEEGAAVAVYELQHFLQWGTPEDLQEYAGWSRAFDLLAQPRERGVARGALVVPMAGLGQRFAREGYVVAKPSIVVSGRPMAVQAALELPAAVAQSFVVRDDMPGHKDIIDQLERAFPQSLTVSIPGVTQGQACTAELGLAALEAAGSSLEIGPLTIGVCDSACLYDEARLNDLLDEGGADVVVWGARRHPHAARHPQMYGWIDEERGIVRRVSVKQPLADPATDAIVIGIFTFRDDVVFRRCFERMLARDARVNGEFYLDTCINDALALGMRCVLLEVDAYFSWGTPNDLRTFQYWQSCFHKIGRHSYRLENDVRVPSEAVEPLAHQYRPLIPPMPATTFGSDASLSLQ